MIHFNSYTGGMLKSPPAKKLRKAQPVNDLSWAAYYFDRLDRGEATSGQEELVSNLAWSYLLFAAMRGDV